MIRSIAIDDEPAALIVIEKHAARVDFLSLEGAFVDPFQAVAFLQEHPVELVFLDIDMPEIDGLSLLKKFIHDPLVIFTTAHSEYAVASYEVEAVDYLLKPFDFARFLQAVTRARERLAVTTDSPRDFFFVNTGRQRRRLVYDSIQYLEGEGNYVRYHTSEGPVLVRSSVREALEGLPADRFVQIHRSYVVALERIEKIEDNHVYIAGARLPVSSTYREGFWRMVEGR